MKYYKNIENGYIVSISTQQGQIEITKEQYEEILSVVKTAPREEGVEYKLKEDLTWGKIEADMQLEEITAL